MSPRLRNNPPLQLLICLVSILIFGLFMVFSASSALGVRVSGSSFHFFNKQLFFLLIGLIAFACTARLPYQIYEKLGYLIMAVVLVLMVLVLIPGIGQKVYGARRWIRFMGIGIQPSELLKIAVIIWAAAFFHRKKEYLSQFSHTLMPSMIVLMVYLVLLVEQRDFGSTVLLSLTLLLMAITYGVRLLHVLLTLMLATGGAIYLVFRDAYRIRRIVAFLDPWADPYDSGYQLINSLVAFGSGGWFGQGLGGSLQKKFFLPQPHTDFMFAIIGEELGFIGVFCTLGLFLWLFFLGFRIAMTCAEDFGRNMAYGITILLAMQTVLHMCVVTGLLPIKGIGLPLISYGGSSLVATLIMMGILYNIAKTHADPAPYAGKTIRNNRQYTRKQTGIRTKKHIKGRRNY